MKNFLTKQDVPIKTPIQVKVFQDYDKLDIQANKKGYTAIEPDIDQKVYTEGSVGLQQANLHCGWIAIISDSRHKAEDQISLLNKKIGQCIELEEKIIIGFCQTGHFSIGYSIYVKIKV